MWAPLVRNSKMRPIPSLHRHQCTFCINVSHPFGNHANNDTNRLDHPCWTFFRHCKIHFPILYPQPTFSVAHFNLLSSYCLVRINFFFIFWLAKRANKLFDADRFKSVLIFPQETTLLLARQIRYPNPKP